MVCVQGPSRTVRPRAIPAPVVRVVDAVGFFFPGLIVLTSLAAAYWCLMAPHPARFLLTLSIPYLVPLLLFRLMVAVLPIKEGGSVLAKGVWSSWFLSYRLQLIYGYFPFLEGALLAFPGLFSWWLRAWGSKVGKGVFWAATVQITDRGHLDIGDGAFFGNAVYLSPHVVQRRGGRGILYFKRIRIGKGSFVGAGCRLGPGVVVHDGALVPLLTDLYLKEEFPPPEAT